MKTEYPKKVNFQEYENAFNNDLLKNFEEGCLKGFDTEKMRGLIYGYTFTEDYKKGMIPDTLSVDYWKQIEKDRFANVSKDILHDAFSALSLSEYLEHEQLILDTLMEPKNEHPSKTISRMRSEAEQFEAVAKEHAATMKRPKPLPHYGDDPCQNQ